MRINFFLQTSVFLSLCWAAMETPPTDATAALSTDATAVSEAAENLSIEITVLTLSGETLVVSLSPDSTLLDLKREIKSRSGHLIEIQQFSSEETVFIGPDRRKLREFGLVSGSVTLTLVLKGLDVDMHIETLRGKGSMREADDIRILCALSEDIFLKEPPLLELQPPLVMGGHVMGCASQLHYLFDTFGEPSESQYLFLGCYVSRGKRSIDTFTLLLLYKKKYPEKIHLLRGQHESAQISRIYGFYDECKSSWLVVSTYFSWSPKYGMIDSQIIINAIHISSLIKHVLLQQPFLVQPSVLPRKVQCEDLERFCEGLQLVTFRCPDPGAHLLRSLGAVAQFAASKRSSADPTACGCARGLARGPQKVQLLKRIHPK